MLYGGNINYSISIPKLFGHQPPSVLRKMAMDGPYLYRWDDVYVVDTLSLTVIQNSPIQEPLESSMGISEPERFSCGSKMAANPTTTP